MKFFAFFAVAILALSVSANSLELREEHNKIYLEHNIKEYINDFAVFFERFYEYVNEFFLQFFKGFFETFSQVFPTELSEAVMEIFRKWPAFDKVFTKEFFHAIGEFFHTVFTYFMPHQFFTVIENTLKSLPTFTEFLPKEFFPTIGNFLEHVPYCREFLQQWYMIMQQLTAHGRQL
uniref:Uncharacterized protein n=1 Tax=Glossina palpalis gambiensis TaxID=67801 RepID=A0A1B0AVY1_9MUSC